MADNTVPSWAEYLAPTTESELNLSNPALCGSITMQIPEPVKMELGINSTEKGPTTITIPFYLESDFGFSLENKWDTMVPSTATEVLSTLVDLLSFSGIEAVGGPQFQVISRAMQTLAWKGSENPQFTINCTFICTQRNYNPANIIMALSAACLPLSRDSMGDDGNKVVNTASNTLIAVHDKTAELAKNYLGIEEPQTTKDKVNGLFSSMGLIAPLAYEPQMHYEDDTSTIKNGEVSLNIGNWFNAYGLVVKSISNIAFSKEVIAPIPNWSWVSSSADMDGFPLYAKCSITLTPHLPITYSDFCNYFTFKRVVTSTSAEIVNVNMADYAAENATNYNTSDPYWWTE